MFSGNNQDMFAGLDDFLAYQSTGLTLPAMEQASEIKLFSRFVMFWCLTLSGTQTPLRGVRVEIVEEWWW